MFCTVCCFTQSLCVLRTVLFASIIRLSFFEYFHLKRLKVFFKFVHKAPFIWQRVTHKRISYICTKIIDGSLDCLLWKVSCIGHEETEVRWWGRGRHACEKRLLICRVLYSTDQCRKYLRDEVNSVNGRMTKGIWSRWEFVYSCPESRNISEQQVPRIYDLASSIDPLSVTVNKST